MTGMPPSEPAHPAPAEEVPIPPAPPPDEIAPERAGGIEGTEPVTDIPPTTAPAPLPQHRIQRTRTGGLWVAVAAAALVLLFLLIFILQNSQQVRVSFLGADGQLALGVAMLLSAVAGALLVVLIGTARIVQLRLVARRHRGRDAAVRRR